MSVQYLVTNSYLKKGQEPVNGAPYFFETALQPFTLHFPEIYIILSLIIMIKKTA